VIVYLERFPWKTRKWEIVYEVNNYVNNFSKQLRKQCPKLLPSLPPWADAAVGGWPRATAVFGYPLIENLSFPFPMPLLYLSRHGRAGLTGLKETIDSTCK
jgi:hypothetical protein